MGKSQGSALECVIVTLEVTVRIDTLHLNILGQILTGDLFHMGKEMRKIGFSLFVTILKTRSYGNQQEDILTILGSGLCIGLGDATEIEARLSGQAGSLKMVSKCLFQSSAK